MPGHSAPKDIAESLKELGVRFSQCQDLTAAQLVFAHAFLIQREAFGLEDPDVVASLVRLATIYRMQGRPREADLLFNFAKDAERHRLAAAPKNSAETSCVFPSKTVPIE